MRTDPLLGMRFKGSSGERRHVEDEEVDAALSVAPDSVVIRLVQAYIRLKLMMGVRRGDLLRLRLSDITEEGIRVRPSKTADDDGRDATSASC